MKKQYMKPAMQVVNIEVSNMIATSPLYNTNNAKNTSENAVTEACARERGMSDFNLSNDLW